MKKWARYLVAVVFLLLVAGLRVWQGAEEVSFEGGHFTCVLDLQGHKAGGMNYSVGFNYEMLRHFALAQHCGMEVILAEPEDSISDYLSIDTVDIVVRPWKDGHSPLPSRVLADSSTWVSRDKSVQRAVNRWLANFEHAPEYQDIRERFTPSYEPLKRAASGNSYKYAGPYDALVKKYAAAIGWDWRMLEAVIWQESKFRIEARSPKGAVGLMQMMPSTARRYGVDDMLDPEENIRAGADYLRKLGQMFAGRAATQNDLSRFTLAAYNAGEGRVLDCIRFGESLGMPNSTWADIEEIIPWMQLAEPYSITRHGVFKGRETIAYIHRIDTLYRAFCVIAP